MDRIEPTGPGSLSLQSLCAGNLCCCLYLRALAEGGAMGDLLSAGVEGVFSWGSVPSVCLVSRRLLPGACSYSLGFYDLAIGSQSSFWGFAFSCLCLFEMSFTFFLSRQPRIQALFSRGNSSNKTAAWFFHVGVDRDGCNGASLISHSLSDDELF